MLTTVILGNIILFLLGGSGVLLYQVLKQKKTLNTYLEKIEEPLPIQHAKLGARELKKVITDHIEKELKQCESKFADGSASIASSIDDDADLDIESLVVPTRHALLTAELKAIQDKLNPKQSEKIYWSHFDSHLKPILKTFETIKNKAIKTLEDEYREKAESNEAEKLDIQAINKEWQEKVDDNDLSWSQKLQNKEAEWEEKIADNSSEWQQKIEEINKDWQAKIDAQSSEWQEKVHAHDDAWKEKLNEQETQWQEQISLIEEPLIQKLNDLETTWRTQQEENNSTWQTKLEAQEAQWQTKLEAQEAHEKEQLASQETQWQETMEAQEMLWKERLAKEEASWQQAYQAQEQDREASFNDMQREQTSESDASSIDQSTLEALESNWKNELEQQALEWQEKLKNKEISWQKRYERLEQKVEALPDDTSIEDAEFDSTLLDHSEVPLDSSSSGEMESNDALQRRVLETELKNKILIESINDLGLVIHIIRQTLQANDLEVFAEGILEIFHFFDVKGAVRLIDREKQVTKASPEFDPTLSLKNAFEKSTEDNRGFIQIDDITLLSYPNLKLMVHKLNSLDPTLQNRLKDILPIIGGLANELIISINNAHEIDLKRTLLKQTIIAVHQSAKNIDIRLKLFFKESAYTSDILFQKLAEERFTNNLPPGHQRAYQDTIAYGIRTSKELLEKHRANNLVKQLLLSVDPIYQELTATNKTPDA